MEKILFWGTGKVAEETFEQCVYLKEYDIVGFVDNDSNKWGKSFKGYKIYRPCTDEFKQIEFDLIVVLTDYYNEIKQQIESELPEYSNKIENKYYCYKNSIINKYKLSDDEEIQEIVRYLKSNPLKVFNYEFVHKYNVDELDVQYDESKGLYYANYLGKRMYFSSKMKTLSDARNYYKSILLEQDVKSPHKYCDNTFGIKGENIKYKARYENAKYELQEVKTPIIMSNEATIDSIISDGKSIARFGDGEWDLMFERKRSWFQKPDTQLAARLNEVMNSRNDNILVALADNFGSLEKYNDSGADGIRQYMVKSRDEIEKILDYSREYANAYVTRPYLIYKDKSKSQYIFDKFKELWANRNVVSIEGKNSKFGVGNDLLDNAKSVKRVLCPQSDAFSCYDKILNYVLSNIEKDKLVIISLGPTATVLAYDLAMNGYQAIDIGHLDNEYEWFLRKANDRVNIPGKHVSEVEQSCPEEDDEKMDSAYRKSILTCIE